MAFNVEKDIFEPTRRSIEKMNKEQKRLICRWCDFSLHLHTKECMKCGGPNPHYKHK